MDMNREELIKNLKSLIEVIEQSDDRRYIAADIKASNTGLEEVPQFRRKPSPWLEHVDLGGRQITINIELGNTKSIVQALKEREQSKKKGDNPNQSNYCNHD